MSFSADLESKAVKENQFAMTLSLATGILMLAGKGAAYFLTGSAAIFSDAAESVVHIVAVAFATFSLWMAVKPVNEHFNYGYERISFLSAGFEGAMIILAALTIIYTAIEKWLTGLVLENLGTGSLLVAGAGLINGVLGLYLIHTGRKNRSIILEANGRHVLTDCWTSIGVFGGLVLVQLTGWLPLDPLCAIAVAANILVSGARLVMNSLSGLLDYSDPAVRKTIQEELDAFCRPRGFQFHGIRVRSMGYRLHVEFHLLFPSRMPIGEAHRLATEIEEQLRSVLQSPTIVTTHLEALEDHGKVHPESHHRARPA